MNGEFERRREMARPAEDRAPVVPEIGVSSRAPEVVGLAALAEKSLSPELTADPPVWRTSKRSATGSTATRSPNRTLALGMAIHVAVVVALVAAVVVALGWGVDTLREWGWLA